MWTGSKTADERGGEMTALYFMHKKFEGHCFALDEPIESRDIQLLFKDSWYWLHYRFFNCRDRILSESPTAVQTHLYNLAASLYASYEKLEGESWGKDQKIDLIIGEAVDIAEYAKEFAVCVWTYGDSLSEELLKERLSGLPSEAATRRLLTLPHLERLESERLSYGFIAEGLAEKRYRRELGNFNKRKKDGRRNEQRERSKAGSNGQADPIA
jgi:hypothetical protein